MTKIGETKKKILNSLKQKSKTLTDLSNELQLAPSTVAEHIQELERMNAIREIDDTGRKWKYYEISPGFVVSEQTFVRRYRFAISAVVIILIAAAAIYSFLPRGSTTCVASPGYSCSGVSVTSSGMLSLKVSGFNSPTHITGVGCSYNSSEPSSFSTLSINVSAGGFATFNITCNTAPTNFNGTVHIWLNYTHNGNASVENVATITVYKPVIAPTTTTIAPSTSTIISTTAASTTVPATTSIGADSTTTAFTTSTTTSTSSTSTTVKTSTTTTIQQSGYCNVTVTLAAGQTDTCGPFAAQFTGISPTYVSPPYAANFSIFFNSNLNFTTQLTTGQQTYPIGGDNLIMTVNTISQTSNTVTLSMGVQTNVPALRPGCNSVATIYVGENDTCGAIKLKLLYFNSTSGSYNPQADFAIYSNGYLINATPIALTQGNSIVLVVGGQVVRVTVNQTFYGLYPYQRFAKTILNVTPFQAAGCGNTTLVYVSFNDTCGTFTVHLNALGGPRSAAINVYNKGVLTNVSALTVNQTGTYTVNGNTLSVYMSQVNAGQYANQKWVLMRLSVAQYFPPPTSGCSQLITMYVGQNNTCGPYTFQLAGLGSPSGSGVRAADVNVYFSGILQNTSAVLPGSTGKFVGGDSITLNAYVNSTVYAGSNPYQQYSTLKMNVTNWPVNYGSACATNVIVYLDSNVTCNNFTVNVNGNLVYTGPLGYNGGPPNAVPVAIYYNGILSNVSDVRIGTQGNFTEQISGIHRLTVKVLATQYNYTSPYLQSYGDGWAQIFVNSS
ncbi:MAG TPA: winged helix-turn-helix domain-containing protein [Candidatus Acidoferrum sp.]|nr:winged helix-turn-helix domain-containing protein [Candidatus Acidoferrum sp.]